MSCERLAGCRDREFEPPAKPGHYACRTDRTNDCLRRMDSMIEEMQTNLLKGDPSDSLNGPLESKPGLDDRLTFHLVECQVRTAVAFAVQFDWLRTDNRMMAWY